MTLLLWFCSLAVLGVVLAAWREGRAAAPDRWWSYPVQPAPAERGEAGPLMRPSPRPALQTGVAILAVVLAIDVSAAPLAQLAPIEPAAASGVYDFTSQDSVAAYAPASWTLPATAADGWFV